MSVQRPIGVLVLGMHRSGTSAATRVLNLLGMDLGGTLKAPADDNPSGFWEHEAVVAIHERLFDALGMAWDDPRPLPDDWRDLPAARTATDEIEALLAAEFRDKPIWAVKDPRLCRFVPIWREAFDRCGMEPRALIINRDPREVAKSLWRRNAMPEGVGQLLWARYMQEAEAGTRGLKRCLVDYASLLSDWRAVRARVVDELGIDLDASSSDRRIDAFLSEALRHHRHDDEPVQEWIAPMAQALGASSVVASDHALSRLAAEVRALEDVIQPYLPAISGLSEMLAGERDRAASAEEEAIAVSNALAAATEWGATRDKELRQAVAKVQALQHELEQATAWEHRVTRELLDRAARERNLERELGEATSWGATKDAELLELVTRARSLEQELEEATSWGASKDAELQGVVSRAHSLKNELEEATTWGASKNAELQDVVSRAHSLEDELEEATAWGASRNAELQEISAALERSWTEREEIEHQLRSRNDELAGLTNVLNREIEQLNARVSADAQASHEALQQKQREVDGLQHQTNLVVARIAALEHRVFVAGPWNAMRRGITRGVAVTRRVLKRAIIGAVMGWPGSPANKAARQARMRVLNEARITGSNGQSVLADLEVLAQDRWPARPAYVLRSNAAGGVTDIDVSVVVHHSERWVEGFVASLLALDYPLERIHLYVRDHSGNDWTRSAFDAALAEQQARLGGYVYTAGANAGFGAGHNHNLRMGKSAHFLICNVDGRFRPGSVRTIVDAALHSSDAVAAWEFRQAPYEHPKYYDPVTMLTSWVSGACVMFRRSALLSVRGFDDRIFMYGEDVDLSYRLRGRGHRLAYVPSAVYDHDTYLEPEHFKPLQFHGSTLANILLRLRFGTLADLLPIPSMWRELGVAARQQGVYRGYQRSTLRLLAQAPAFLLTRHRRGVARIPFMRWDYGLRREGAFEEVATQLADAPLVSIVVRTYRGRDELLRQALASIANQTYAAVEAIVVEDKGSSMRAVAEECAAQWGMTLRYVACESETSNRCVTGNVGLENARGEFACFLDDDDLLFADHVEYLVPRLAGNPEAGACYALAWETKVIVDAESGRYREVMHSSLPRQRIAFDRELLRTTNYIPIQSALFRRSLFERYGGFNTRLENLEDWNLWCRYSWRHDFVMCPKTTSIYHVPGEQSRETHRQASLDEYYLIAKSESDVAREHIDAAWPGNYAWNDRMSRAGSEE